MALLENGTYLRARYFGGALDALARPLGGESSRRFGNALAFGRAAAWPQGYTQVTRALVSPFVASGQIATRARVDADLAAAVGAIGNLVAAPAVEIDLTAVGNVLRNGAATFALEAGLAAAIRSTGNIAAVFDLPARPTADDVAQATLNGLAIEGGMSVAQILRVLLAAAAGKTAITTSPSTVVRFRDLADTKDRIVGDMTGSERVNVTLDGT